MRSSALPLLVLLSGLIVLLGTVVFASLRPEYSHVRHTISELGESGAALGNYVSYGIFLPAGLLVWGATYLGVRSTTPYELKASIALLSCLGTGYVMAAMFPCDPGSPLLGTWRQQIHNLFGLIEYAGTAAGLILAGYALFRRGAHTIAILLGFAGSLVLVCLIGLSIASAFPVRGVIQRIAETIMFLGTAIVFVSVRSEA